MRVLHVFDPAVAWPTDYGRRAQALLAALRAQGIQTVHVAGPALAMHAPAPARVPAPDAWPDDTWHLYRTRVPRLPSWLQARLPGYCRAAAPAVATTALALRLHRVARLTRPDLVHVHAPSAHAAAAWPVARLARVPLVVEIERRAALPGMPPSPGRAAKGSSACSRAACGRAERFACARAEALAAPSIDVRATLRAAGMRGQRIAILPQAADVPCGVAIDPGPDGLDGAPLLSYAGPLDRAEGIDLLLATMAVLRRRHPTLRLLVAGGGDRTDALATRVAQSSLRGHVILTGQLAGRRAADAMARADIAVFPALAGSATALAPSRHLLNAMALGCAVVASDLPAHRELIVHGHSGMLFPAGSGAALVEVLDGLLAAPWRLRPLGHAATAFAATCFTWDAAAAGYRQLYEQVVTSRA